MERPDLSGKYKLISSKGMSDYLEANGAGFIVRKLWSNAKPELEVTQHGDTFIFTIRSPPITQINHVTVGETLDEKVKDGTMFKILGAWDGDTLVEFRTPATPGRGRPHVHRRQLGTDGQLIVTLQVDDVLATRVFKRVAPKKTR